MAKDDKSEVSNRIKEEKVELVRRYACAALSGLERDLVHMPEAEVSRLIWNLAEAMAKEGARRGY